MKTFALLYLSVSASTYLFFSLVGQAQNRPMNKAKAVKWSLFWPYVALLMVRENRQQKAIKR